MRGIDLQQLRRLAPAALESEFAALGEAAAGEFPGERRHLPGNLRERPRALRRAGERRKELLRVRVLRRAKERFAWRDFHDLARVHHRHAVGHLRHDAEVVRDEQERHAALALQLRQQLEDLRLDGDVECGGRLVGDQHFGIHRERARDHHALAQSSGELERVLVHTALGLGNAHGVEQFQGALAYCGAAQARVALDHFRDLPAHGEHGIERGGGLLEDHRRAPAAHRAHRGLGQREQVHLAQAHAAACDAPHVGQQPQDGQRGHRLAAPRFAHQREALALLDLEVDAVDGPHHPVGRVELGAQPLDLEHGAHTRTRGSKPSRTASAKRLAASTSANMKTNAAASDHHTIGSRAISMRAALIMVPKLMVDGSTPTPT